MFFFIFFFITFGFGNTFFILSFLDRPDNIDEKMTGPNMWTAFLFAYRTTLADIQVDKFEEKHHYQALFYIFFIFETLMILIVNHHIGSIDHSTSECPEYTIDGMLSV